MAAKKKTTKTSRSAIVKKAWATRRKNAATKTAGKTKRAKK